MSTYYNLKATFNILGHINSVPLEAENKREEAIVGGPEKVNHKKQTAFQNGTESTL